MRCSRRLPGKFCCPLLIGLGARASGSPGRPSEHLTHPRLTSPARAAARTFARWRGPWWGGCRSEDCKPNVAHQFSVRRGRFYQQNVFSAAQHHIATINRCVHRKLSDHPVQLFPGLSISLPLFVYSLCGLPALSCRQMDTETTRFEENMRRELAVENSIH